MTPNQDQMRKTAVRYGNERAMESGQVYSVYCLHDERRAETQHKDGPFVWYARPLDGSLGDPCPPFEPTTIEAYLCRPGMVSERIKEP